jgi:hypothetical protein
MSVMDEIWEAEQKYLSYMRERQWEQEMERRLVEHEASYQPLLPLEA